MEGGMTIPSDAEPVSGDLTEREAFLVMIEFIWQYARRAGDDLLTLLGDTWIDVDDGPPTDRAAWSDWQECVRYVKSGGPPRRSDI
jgi:hypothetical protein